MFSLPALLLAAMSAIAPVTVIGTPSDYAAGNFNDNLNGYSVFTEAGDNAQVYGQYRNLRSNRAYFTVAYGNGNCDPAQAFPVGPFTTNGRGRASLAASVPLNGVDLAGTGSISVRIGDTNRNGTPTDQDGDGLTGPTDVVAIPGQPRVGLVECDRSVVNLP